MDRRDFLEITAAGALSPLLGRVRVSAAGPSPATVLYDDRSVSLSMTGMDPRNVADALWVRKNNLPDINGFTIKPEGACRAEVCVPIPKDMMRGQYFNLTAFSKKIGQSVVSDFEARVWSFGEIPVFRGAFLESRIAPDFAVPDRKGRIVHLSDFRGKKLLVTTWASW